MNKPAIKINRLDFITQQFPEARRHAAKDGSKRLLVKLCIYHAKNHKNKRDRDFWAARAKEISFGN